MNSKIKVERPTGNIAVDMAFACMKHYRQFGHRVRKITFSHDYWNKFVEYLKKELPQLEFNDEVQFKNTVFKKGSIFQVEHMIPETYKQMASA